MLTPEEFEERWLDRLSSGAKVIFRCGTLSDDALIHTAIADAFVESLGLKPIGFNWELLDFLAPIDGTRSAVGEIAKALSFDLNSPGKPWLQPGIARECAENFLGLFDPGDLTVVSNRYDGLWHPIAGGDVEWGFVGFDASSIGLLLLVSK